MALVAWVGCRTDWTEVGTAFAGMRVEIWLAAVGMLLMTQILSAWRWQALARPFGFECTVKKLTSYYLIGMYFNLVLPTTVGGDVVRAWYLDGGSGRRLAAFVSVFVDRFSGLIVLLGLACLGLALSPLELPRWIDWFVWGTGGCAVCAIAVAPLLARDATAPKSTSGARRAARSASARWQHRAFNWSANGQRHSGLANRIVDQRGCAPGLLLHHGPHGVAFDHAAGKHQWHRLAGIHDGVVPGATGCCGRGCQDVGGIVVCGIFDGQLAGRVGVLDWPIPKADYFAVARHGG
jgi:hypothetical protein